MCVCVYLSLLLLGCMCVCMCVCTCLSASEACASSQVITGLAKLERDASDEVKARLCLRAIQVSPLVPARHSGGAECESDDPKPLILNPKH